MYSIIRLEEEDTWGLERLSKVKNTCTEDMASVPRTCIVAQTLLKYQYKRIQDTLSVSVGSRHTTTHIHKWRQILIHIVK